MKIARVIPLYKAGEKKLLTNYRPVSLLPQFSKILENIYYSRSDKFISNMTFYQIVSMVLGKICQQILLY